MTPSEFHQFYDKSTPDEYKSKEWFQNAMKSENPHLSLLKGFEGQAALIGKRTEGGLQLPGDNATPEQWDDFFKSVGRPDDAEGYAHPEIQWADDQKELATALSASRPESFMADMKILAHKAGLTPAQFAYLSENYDRVFLHHNAETLRTQQEASKAQNMEFTERAQQVYGDKYMDVMTQGGETLAKVLNPQLKPLIDKAASGGTLSGNEVLLLLSGTVEGMSRTYMKEDNFNTKGGSSAPMTKDDIAAASLKILNSPEFQDPMHQGHQQAVASWNNLFAPKVARK